MFDNSFNYNVYDQRKIYEIYEIYEIFQWKREKKIKSNQFGGDKYIQLMTSVNL